MHYLQLLKKCTFKIVSKVYSTYNLKLYLTCKGLVRCHLKCIIWHSVLNKVRPILSDGHAIAWQKSINQIYYFLLSD